MHHLFQLHPALHGLLLMLALIVAVGPQNAWLLSHAVGRSHHILIAGVCIVIDVALVSLGVSGVGTVAAQTAWLTWGLTAAGVLFLLGYGAQAMRAAVRPTGLNPTASLAQTPRTAVAGTLVVSLVNPHIYLDTMVLLAGAGAGYVLTDRLLFTGGALAGSVTWFCLLTLGGHVLAPLFARDAAWRVVNTVVAIVMWLIAFGLAGRLFGSL